MSLPSLLTLAWLLTLFFPFLFHPSCYPFWIFHCIHSESLETPEATLCFHYVMSGEFFSVWLDWLFHFSVFWFFFFVVWVYRFLTVYPIRAISAFISENLSLSTFLRKWKLINPIMHPSKLINSLFSPLCFTHVSSLGCLCVIPIVPRFPAVFVNKYLVLLSTSAHLSL